MRIILKMNGMKMKRVTISSKRRSVLVIDDDADVREFMSSLLSVYGFDVVTVSNGPSGIETLRSIHIDVIIVDVNMPGMDGYHVIDIIRPLIKSGMKIFLWSTLSSIKPVDGVGVLEKPFDINEFLEKISHDNKIYSRTTDDKGRNNVQTE